MRRRYLIALFGLLFLLVRGISADARTWRVTPDHTGDAPTIQAAVDSASPGDDVLLARGTYTWTSEGAVALPPYFAMVHVLKEITLHSEAGPEVTILDAENRGRPIYLLDAGAVHIEGLTLTRGTTYGFGEGGGLFSTGDTRPAISNCVVRRCSTLQGKGGGIACENARFTNCQILSNRVSDGGGGGIAMVGGSITGCTIRGNVASGIERHTPGGGILGSDIAIADCRIESNTAGGYPGDSGGGVYLTGGSVVSCVFLGNANFGDLGGGSAILGASCTISECVFIGNTSHGMRLCRELSQAPPVSRDARWSRTGPRPRRTPPCPSLASTWARAAASATRSSSPTKGLRAAAVLPLRAATSSATLAVMPSATPTAAATSPPTRSSAPLIRLRA